MGFELRSLYRCKLCHNTNRWLYTVVFYNIYTVFKYSTKKKDLNPKTKMGTNSFGVHNSQTLYDSRKRACGHGLRPLFSIGVVSNKKKGLLQCPVQRGAEISFFPQPLLNLLKVGLQLLQMGSVAPMKSPYVT